jgi:hypothetical protein
VAGNWRLGRNSANLHIGEAHHVMSDSGLSVPNVMGFALLYEEELCLKLRSVFMNVEFRQSGIRRFPILPPATPHDLKSS